MKKYLLVFIFTLFVALFFFPGCGSDGSGVPVISTPTIVQPTAQPTVQPTAAPSTHVVSSLTEIEAKRVTVSAKDGGSFSEGNLTLIVPGDALENDSSVEIARVNMKQVTASSRSDISDIYKISTGINEEGADLQKPAIVRIHGGNDEAPYIWSGTSWLPVDYTYDANTQEIVLNLSYLEQDGEEWEESGGELGTINGPAVIGKGKSKDMPSLISSKKHFKVFYNNDQEKSYAESIAGTLEDAYDYYTSLGYNKPITSDFQLENDPNNYLVAVYIYPYSSGENPDSRSYGIAGTGGTLEINKKLVDANRGKSVFYHELFHLVQFSYDKNASFYNWFTEATAMSMEYKAINRPVEIYDCNSGEYWDTSVWNETFDSDDAYYTKFPFWSYIIRTYGKNTNVLHNIMKSPFKKRNGEEFNEVFKTLLNKDMVTCLNENTEDYYINGNFFNKTYFYSFKDREPNQPFISLMEKKSKEPDNSATNVSITRLSTKYICYSSTNYHDTFKLELSDKSSNCKVKLFYVKNNSGNYSVTQEEINDTKTIDHFGNDFKYLFVLVENTSINTNATVAIKTSINN